MMKINSTGWATMAVTAGLSLSAMAAPYYDWMNDYTGTEANTMLLFKFDNEADPGYDSSGNDWTGAFTTTQTVPSAAEGKFGRSFQSEPPHTTTNAGFAAISGSGLLADNLWNNPAMSVEMWFKPDSAITTTTGGNYYLVDNNRTSTVGGLMIWLGGRAEGDHRLGFSVANGTTRVNLMSDFLEWDSDTWYHVAATFETVDGDTTLRTFRDGVEIASNTHVGFGDPLNRDTNWRIGNRATSAYSSAPGFYDNFRVSSVSYNYAIPEPGTLTTLLLGGVGISLARKAARRKSR